MICELINPTLLMTGLIVGQSYAFFNMSYTHRRQPLFMPYVF